MKNPHMRVEISSLLFFSLSSLIPHFLTSASWDCLQSKHLPQPLASGSAFRKTQTKALFKTIWLLLRESHDFYDFITGMEIRAFFCPFILKSHCLSYSSGKVEDTMLLFLPLAAAPPPRAMSVCTPKL